MVNINAPDAGNDGNIERKSQEPLQNLHKLYKAGLEKCMFDASGNIDPAKFELYKKNPASLKDDIPRAMKALRFDDMVNFGYLSEDEINTYLSYYGISIQEEVVRFGLPLTHERNKFRERSLELFPQLRNIGDFGLRLTEMIKDMNLDDLKKYTQRSANLRKFLKQEDHFGNELLETDTKFDIRSVFGNDIDVYFSDKKKRDVLEEMFRNYEKFGYTPDQKDIDFLIRAYLFNPQVQVSEGIRSENLKSVLSYFGAQIPLKYAYATLAWLDKNDLDKIIKSDTDMASIFDTLTAEEQERLRSRIVNDDTIKISVRDLDFSKLSSILKKNKKFKKSLVSFMTSTIDIEKISGGDYDILLRIRQRILKDAENTGTDEYTYDTFEEFKNQVLNHEPSFRQAGEFPVKNFKNFRVGSYILVDNGESRFLARLKSIQDNDGYPGLMLEYFSIDKDDIADQPVTADTTYDQFAMLLASPSYRGGIVYNAEEFDEKIRADKLEDAGKQNSHTKKQIFIRPSYLGDGNQEDIAEMYINTPEALEQELDMIDIAGCKYGFGVGTSFLAPSVEEGTGKINHDDIWTVSKIGNGVVSLMDSDGKQLVKDLPIHSLYTVLASTTGFRRISRIASDIDFVNQLKSIEGIGIDGDVSLHDARLLTKQKDEHGHETEKYITTLAGEKGGHIRLGEIRDGVVYFGDYKDGEDIQKVKDYAKEHGLDKKLKGYYDWKSMSYTAFLEYCKKHKLKKSSKDPILPEEAAHHFAHHDDHHDHSHLEGSFLKKVMKLQNPASIMKGFEMIYHAIEHTLEKGAKLDAARFALGTSRFLNLPASVNAQIYADVVEGSKEIVEKYEKKIFGLPGPAQRLKCIHIAHDKDSRPEEVGAAITVMMKSYGQLYSEDIKHYQPTVNEHNLEHKPAGYFAFFDALVLTSKLPEGLIEWRKKAYKKAITEMGTEDDHEGEPTEEQLIHALFKSIDGNWDKYPYAASVIKAVGGPSGYEKMWKFEGFDTAFKKGKDQTQMVSAQGRLHKAVSYLGTFEIYKAMGAMEAVAGKVKEPEFQAMPFIWAVGGFSRYASHTALQKIKGYAENGFSFHAYSFLRNKSDNDTYKKMVEMALAEMGGKERVDEFQAIVKRLEFNQDDKDATDKAALHMMQFWQRNCHKGLHDMLQGQNGWLLRLRNEGNETAVNYWNTLTQKHSMQLKDGSIPGTDFGKDWYDEHGYQHLIMGEVEGKDKKKYRSVYSMLNKIRFEGGSIGGGARAMNDTHREKIWFYIKKYMNGSLRDANMFQDEELMKEQYLIHRKEILEYFSQQLGARNPGNISPEQFQANMRNHISTYPYYKDLEDMGISPEAVFSAEIQSTAEESDYRRWRNGQKASGSTRGSASRSVMNKIMGTVSATTEGVRGLNIEANPIYDDDTRPPPANADVFDKNP